VLWVGSVTIDPTATRPHAARSSHSRTTGSGSTHSTRLVCQELLLIRALNRMDDTSQLEA